MAKFDEVYPKIVWGHMTAKNSRIVLLYGSSISFQLGLEVYTQYCRKLETLGMCPKKYGFFPPTNGTTPERAMAATLPLVQSEEEAKFLATVMIAYPMSSEGNIILALWQALVDRLKLDPVADGYNPIPYLVEEKVTQVA